MVEIGAGWMKAAPVFGKDKLCPQGIGRPFSRTKCKVCPYLAKIKAEGDPFCPALKLKPSAKGFALHLRLLGNLPSGLFWRPPLVE